MGALSRKTAVPPLGEPASSSAARAASRWNCSPGMPLSVSFQPHRQIVAHAFSAGHILRSRAGHRNLRFICHRTL